MQTLIALTGLGWCCNMRVWSACCFRTSVQHKCVRSPPTILQRRQLCSSTAMLLYGSFGIFRLVLLCRQCIVCCNYHPCIHQAVSSWPTYVRLCSAFCGSAAKIGLQHQCMCFHSRKWVVKPLSGTRVWCVVPALAAVPSLCVK
jgi:hypothetical protein